MLQKVCMILPGGGSRLQTLGGLAAQWFDSTLRTYSILFATLIMNSISSTSSLISLPSQQLNVVTDRLSGSRCSACSSVEGSVTQAGLSSVLCLRCGFSRTGPRTWSSHLVFELRRLLFISRREHFNYLWLQCCDIAVLWNRSNYFPSWDRNSLDERS